MPLWVHRTSKLVLPSVAESELPESVANYIQDPDLSAVAGWSNIYWTISGDNVLLMDAAARDAVDAAARDARRDDAAARLDEVEDVQRAFMLMVLDELNDHSARINAILNAIDAATNLSELKTAVAAIVNLPIRTSAQLKTAIRNKLGT